MALRENGEVVYWGQENNAGDGVETVPASALTGVKDIAVASRSAAVLKEDGQLVIWGISGTSHPARGQVDDAPSTFLQPGAGLQKILAGDTHYSVLESTGRVSQWGYHGWGLDDDDCPSEARSGVIDIEGSIGNQIALKSDGSIVVWGNDMYNQETIPTDVSSETIVGIAAGAMHYLVLNNDGKVYAWGDDTKGQSTVPIDAQSGIVKVFARRDFSFAQKASGAFVIWGDTGHENFTAIPAEVFSGMAVDIRPDFSGTSTIGLAILPE
jgi:alpha-tubulin suppressor-like RCC1 family protein